MTYAPDPVELVYEVLDERSFLSRDEPWRKHSQPRVYLSTVGGNGPDREQLVSEVKHCLDDLLGIINAPLHLHDLSLEHGYLTDKG